MNELKAKRLAADTRLAQNIKRMRQIKTVGNLPLSAEPKRKIQMGNESRVMSVVELMKRVGKPIVFKTKSLNRVQNANHSKKNKFFFMVADAHLIYLSYAV